MRKESNLQPTVLETVALPIELRTCNLERVERLELSSTAWKAVVLPVEPYPQQTWSQGLDSNQRVPIRETDLQSAAFNLSATTAIKLQNHLLPNDFEAESVDL